jgi:glycosyltransferase involved in cell wall biosynthesis
MMNPKKLFISVDWFLPGTKSGGPARSIANLVENLDEVQIFIFTRNTDYGSTEPYSEVPSNTWVKHLPHVHVYYASADQINRGTLKRLLLEVQPDTVYISGIYSRYFSIMARQLAVRMRFYTVVAARGMLSPHALQVKPFKKWGYLLWVRFLGAYRKVHWHATSDIEAKDIARNIGAQSGITFIPNLPRTFEAPPPPLNKVPQAMKLISLGRISPEKGTLKAIEALRPMQGKISLIIYGTISDRKYWQKCYRAIQRLPSHVEVLYHGTLGAKSPELLSVIKGAHALLLPSEGENYGHAIVEFLSQGKPVIIGSKTPWKGLELARAGWETDSSSLTWALQSLLVMGQVTYDQWSQGASSYYREKVLKNVEEQNAKYLEMLKLS